MQQFQHLSSGCFNHAFLMAYQKFFQLGQVQVTMKLMKFGAKPDTFYIEEASRRNGKGKPYRKA